MCQNKCSRCLISSLVFICLLVFPQGYSTSELIYAILDKGTNYCNLHNLVVGSGLTNTTRYGFTETTDDSVCTEYTSANCNKY